MNDRGERVKKGWTNEVIEKGFSGFCWVKSKD